MKLEQVKCPVCGGTVEVDNNFETAKCPFCSSSFVIQGLKTSKKQKEQPVYDLKIIEVDPESVQNELDIYSFFGWDFKHRKTHKVYDGQRKFKNGNYHDQYRDVVQITLQRNVRAKWFTPELIEREKRFFELRKNLKFVNSDIPYEFSKFYENAKFTFKEKVQIAIYPLFGIILSILFFSIGSSLQKLEKYGIALLFLLLVFPCFAGGIICGITIGLKKYKNAKQRKIDEENEIEKNNKLREEDLNRKIEPIKKEMLEILNWAGTQMEAKFGYKLVGKIDL